MTEELDRSEVALAKIAADIVVAFVTKNSLEAGDLPQLTSRVRLALVPPVEQNVGDSAGRPHYFATGVLDEDHGAMGASVSSENRDKGPATRKPLKPAVAISKSVTADYVVCLEDGKKFRSLKRHLRAEHGMSAEEYREKWNLPRHYELVAPSYSAMRAAVAKEHGLGHGPKLPRDVTPKVAAE